MADSSRRVWGFALIGIAGVYLFVFYLLPGIAGSMDGPANSGRCTKPQRHLVAKGISPHDSPWVITASIENNGSCNDWLLEMRFAPSGKAAGSWSGSWSIPSGGHVSDAFTINAHDESESSGRAPGSAERAFSGITGARVRRIDLRTSGGRTLIIHPKLPSARLRARFVWLRNVRYFMRFYPVGDHVTVARLRNAGGDVIYTIRGLEGWFEGPSGSV